MRKDREMMMAGRVSAAFSLEGKSIVISGASGALGGAAARSLHAAGCDLVLSGANADGLKALAAELKGDGRVATITRRPETPADAEAIIGRHREKCRSASCRRMSADRC